MIENVHLHFVLHAPTPGGLKCSRLFDLIDGLDPAVLDDLLIDLYIGYDIPESQTRGQRYADFKRAFLAANASCKDENVVVFGLVTYVLAEAYRKSDIARFERSMDGHRMVLSIVQEQLRKEELPVSELLKHSREVMDQIESLHRELEVSRRSYKMFCDKVVAPLVPRRG
ncbi:MAG TPA: hypothetical protein VH592_25190 [Gemmataceae bacterium]|jgi:hypothetical protein